MTKQEYTTLEHNRKRIKKLLYKLKQLPEPVSAVNITGCTGGSGISNGVEALIIKKADLELEISKLRKENKRICFEIEPLRTRKVFSMFYVDCKTWHEIADDMGYCEWKVPQTMKNRFIKKLK